MQYETNEFLYELVDDGTLDTVIEVTDLASSEQWEERIDQLSAAFFRQADGGFTETDFADLCDMIVD